MVINFLPDAVTKIDGEIAIMRASKQDTVTFVQEAKSRKLDRLTHTRGHQKMTRSEFDDWVELAIDESRNTGSEAIRARKSISIGQSVTVNSKLFSMLDIRRRCICETV